MAEAHGLSSSGRRTAWEREGGDAPLAEGPGARGSHVGSSEEGPPPSLEEERIQFYGEDRSPQRATIYWVLLLVLISGAFLLRDSPWASGQYLHGIMEGVSTVLAGVIGALALVRFYSKKRGTFLFIGTGFIGTAFLDGYHAVITSPLYPLALDEPIRNLSAWSWISSRVFLSLFLYVSWLSWRGEKRAREEPDIGGGPAIDERSVYMTAMALTGIIFVFFAQFPISDIAEAHYPQLVFHRPAEFLPAFIFLLALAGYLGKGAWRKNAFEHWLIIALLVSALSHAAFMAFSDQLYDAYYDAAHLLKIVSYGAVLVGLLVSMFVTFRREEQAFDETRRANQALAQEVAFRREAQRELGASKANLTALFESTGDAIWSVDRNHQLITFNAAYALTVEAMTGREPEKGDDPGRVVPPEELEWFEELYDRALDGERFSEIRTVEAQGQPRYFELYFNPILGERGIAGAVVFSQEITRRKRTEEALRLAKEEAVAANQAKSQFLANMSHELRTPLNSVIGFANILLKNKAGRLESQELSYVERVLANGKHLLQLINEVLDLAKIEAGRMELEVEAVDLDELVKETLAQMESQVKGKPVKLQAEVPAELPELAADRAKLKQVIINLVGNALKFTEEGEVRVRVRTRERDGEEVPTRIDVRDTGPGIPEDRLQAIFEAFQQADGSTARKYGGTGLGLAISRTLCNLMGYELGVTSRLGEGSTFYIDLRVDQREAGEPPPARTLARDGAGERSEPVPAGRPLEEAQGEEVRLRDRSVLVIDDEADSRILLAHYMEDFGCRVFTARSGAEGLEMARKHRVDLITLDLMMPGMNGWEVLRALKADPDLRDIPVVIVSVVAGEGSARVLGAVDLLTKPVERDPLLRALARHMPKDHGRVLVVEDQEDDRQLLRRYLTEAGLEVALAEDGRKGLDLVEAFEPDVVLLDLLMPVMDGTAFLNAIRSDPRRKDLPVVILTAKDLSREERRHLQSQTVGVIAKGPNLEGRMREVLELVFSRPEVAEG